MKLQWAVVLGLFFVTGSLADDTGSYAGEVTASRLNLRAGPGEAFQAVHRVEKGDKLIVRGAHPNQPEWLRVEVPGGFQAWIYARFLARKRDGSGTLTGERVMVRPRPTTKYHQLDGRLEKGEVVKVVGVKKGEEGDWCRIEVPRRFWLYAHSGFIRNIGRVSLAEPKPEEPGKKKGPPSLTVQSRSDKRFVLVEPDLRRKLAAASTSAELAPLKRALSEIKREDLSLENRERRLELMADIVETEKRFAIVELKSHKDKVHTDLERKLKEIEAKYRRRLLEIHRESKKIRKPRFVATGIVQWRPDLIGRWPAYRIGEGGKMRYFLIAEAYELARFVGKRVGVTGITDPESGTGYSTVIVDRIEILGDE